MYYKICRKIDGRYFSMVHDGNECIEYYFDKFSIAPEWLTEEGYYPLVFKGFFKTFAKFYFSPCKDELILCTCKINGDKKSLPQKYKPNKYPKIGVNWKEPANGEYSWPDNAVMVPMVKLKRILFLRKGKK